MIQLEEHAVWVHQLVNIEYFKKLLSAFQKQAATMGFEFVEGNDLCTITENEKDVLGRAILHAKIIDVAPRLYVIEQEKYVASRSDDGEAIRWTDWVLNALAKRGIVLRRSPGLVAVETTAPLSNQSWNRHAYPLQQITINLQGTRHSDKDDIISQVETVLVRLKNGDLSGSSHDDDFGYQFNVELCSPGPSFFDASAGGH